MIESPSPQPSPIRERGPVYAIFSNPAQGGDSDSLSRMGEG
jgi:hypothetical protein